MLGFSQAEAIRIAVLSQTAKASPDENISVAVNRHLNAGGSVQIVTTRSQK
jgi:hypothetical protein